MKHLKHLIVVALAVMATFVMAVPAFAQTITITPPEGIATDSANSYDIYKVFDAEVDATDTTKVSYKLCANDSLSDAMKAAGFLVDDGGNVLLGTTSATATGATGEYQISINNGTLVYFTPQTDELNQTQIDAIADYVTAADKVATATSTGTANAVSGDLAFGYYYITTTTGTVVTIDSNNNTTPVKDKNSIPGPPVKTIFGVDVGTFDEAGKKAIAEVGTDVDYQAEIVKVKGAKNYVFHDVMGDGLSYNNDVKVYVGDAEVAATNYNTTLATGDSVTVSFDNAWLANLTDDTTITIKYSAKITSDALTIETGKNTATLEYGNKAKTEGDSTNVYDATFTITKKTGDDQPLAGAGFIIKNSDNKYYGGIDGTTDKIKWVDAEADAEVHTSDAQGAVPAFTGLANGTYTVIEKVVPSGYNKAADSTFTIADNDFTAQNITQTAEVINNSGAELPSTGGIGTTIFYVIGAILVIGAGVVLITKRRVAAARKDDELI